MITVRLSGGMGNQMFQYALGRKLSLQYDTPLKLDTTFLLQRVSFPALLRPNFVFRDYDLDVFAIKATIADKKDMAWWQRPILSGKAMLAIDAVLRKMPVLRGWEKSFTFDPKVLTLGPDVYLAGFWQSEKYFQDIRTILLEDFTLAKPLSDKSQSLQKEIQETESVCIHVRRSDMAAKPFHGAIDVAYYDKAIQYVSEHAAVSKLYIFSDDIEWCKNNMHFNFETMFVGSEYAGQKGEGHMVLMSACKHFIIPNSTFSWWGTWLATNSEKIVVTPKQWFNDAAINSSDLIPKEWVRI